VRHFLFPQELVNANRFYFHNYAECDQVSLEPSHHPISMKLSFSGGATGKSSLPPRSCQIPADHP
jgi:hypothetical protein